jgi:hypothetical protein
LFYGFEIRFLEVSLLYRKEEEVIRSEISEVFHGHDRFFSPKTPRLKASCVRACCHGAGTTVASHNEPTVSDYSKLGEENSG